jgi:FtsZ-interacting cell division protein ZipA
MTNERHQPGHGSEFELEDFRPATIYAFLIGLAVACIVVAVAVWTGYKVADSFMRARQPKNPMVELQADTRKVMPAEVKQFAEPRLEINERTEINQFRLQEEQRLHSYSWVDESAGVVRIPIDRAMQLLAERGLPTTPKAGEYPPSTVNTINQAVQRADTSVLARQTKPHTPQGGKVQQ